MEGEEKMQWEADLWNHLQSCTFCLGQFSNLYLGLAFSWKYHSRLNSVKDNIKQSSPIEIKRSSSIEIQRSSSIEIVPQKIDIYQMPMCTYVWVVNCQSKWQKNIAGGMVRIFGYTEVLAPAIVISYYRNWIATAKYESLE